MEKVLFTMPSYYRGKAYGKCTALEVESSQHNIIISPVDASGRFSEVEVVIPKADVETFISVLRNQLNRVKDVGQ